MKDWDTLEKPWSREDCRDRYVQGRAIGLRPLAEISGVSIGSLNRWSRSEGWPEQRSQFRGKVITETDAKVLNAISEANSVILATHATEAQEFRSLAMSLQSAAKSIAETFSDKEDPYRVQAVANAASLSVSVFKSSIDIERQARGLDYEDINRAVAAVEKAGLKAVDASEYELFKQYLAAQTQEEDFELATGQAIEVEADNPAPTP